MLDSIADGGRNYGSKLNKLRGFPWCFQRTENRKNNFERFVSLLLFVFSCHLHYWHMWHYHDSWHYAIAIDSIEETRRNRSGARKGKAMAAIKLYVSLKFSRVYINTLSLCHCPLGTKRLHDASHIIIVSIVACIRNTKKEYKFSWMKTWISRLSLGWFYDCFYSRGGWQRQQHQPISIQK